MKTPTIGSASRRAAGGFDRSREDGREAGDGTSRARTASPGARRRCVAARGRGRIDASSDVPCFVGVTRTNKGRRRAMFVNPVS